MRKLVKRLSGTNKKDSGKGLVNLQRIDVAALNRGFDEDGDGFEPSSPAQRLASPGSWGEKAVTENSAAIKMQARVRGKKARAEVARLSVLSEVSTAPPAKPALAFPEPPSGRTQWPAPPSAAANRNDAELEAARSIIAADASDRAEAKAKELEAAKAAASNPSAAAFLAAREAEAAALKAAQEAEARSGAFNEFLGGGVFSLCTACREKRVRNVLDPR